MAKREERAVVIASVEGAAGPEPLEGLFVAGSGREGGGAVIAPPHPLYGGSMDSPVVSELAWSCTRAGLASLRFNWRGVGASAGVPSGDLGAGIEDFGAALRDLGHTVAGSLVAAGYSFGAVVAARAAVHQPRVRRLLLVAPPPALLEPEMIEQAGYDVLIVAGAHDALAPPDRLAELVRGLPRGRLVRVEEADHFFGAGLADLGREAAAWLEGGTGG
jgi:hypothetical protein